LLRLWQQARGVRARLIGAAIVGALASGCAVALMATSAWLIARAAEQPPVHKRNPQLRGDPRGQ